MNPEQRNIPSWAERERWADMAWIWQNLPLFHFAAVESFRKAGRGAIVVDTTSVASGDGHPCAYFNAEAIHRYGDGGIDQLVEQYLPHEELVVVLIKPADRTSAYRVRALPPEEQTAITRS